MRFSFFNFGSSSRTKASKRKSYNAGKKERQVMCPCGGTFIDGVRSNLPRYKHQITKMHQEFLANGNVMATNVKARLDKKVAEKKALKEHALVAKRSNQTLCGCGSYYNKSYVDMGRGEYRHYETAKHNKWALKNNA